MSQWTSKPGQWMDCRSAIGGNSRGISKGGSGNVGRGSIPLPTLALCFWERVICGEGDNVVGIWEFCFEGGGPSARFFGGLLVLGECGMRNSGGKVPFGIRRGESETPSTAKKRRLLGLRRVVEGLRGRLMAFV